MPRGRPAKPMYSPIESAYADLEEGAMSFEQAAEFTSLSKTEIELVVYAGEIETFPHKRRVLLVRKSVRMWLTKKLEAERTRRFLAAECPKHFGDQST